MRIFFFPFGGGASYAYRPFIKLLENDFTVKAYDLPGHGTRLPEKLLTSFDEMTDDLLGQIQNSLNEPYAFFGHSLGGYLSYFLCHRIKALNLNLPTKLFISSTRAPSAKARERGFHILSRVGLLEKIQEMGGTPPGFFDEPELQDMFIPIFRADFRAVSTYKHTIADELAIPIVHLRGKNENIPEDQIESWQEETSAKVTFHEFPGNHFYLFEHIDEITKLIYTELSTIK